MQQIEVHSPIEHKSRGLGAARTHRDLLLFPMAQDGGSSEALRMQQPLRSTRSWFEVIFLHSSDLPWELFFGMVQWGVESKSVTMTSKPRIYGRKPPETLRVLLSSPCYLQLGMGQELGSLAAIALAAVSPIPTIVDHRTQSPGVVSLE